MESLSNPQIAAVAFGLVVFGMVVGAVFSAVAWRLMHRAGNTPRVSSPEEVYRPVVLITTVGGAIAAVVFVAIALAV